jgi:hypothetical protein
MFTMWAWRIWRRFTTSVGLRTHRENAHLAGLHIVEHGARHVAQRARGQVFQDPGIKKEVVTGQFVGQRDGDFAARQVGNQRDFFFRANAQTADHGVARAGRQICIERQCQQLFPRVHCAASANRPRSVSAIM